MKCHISQELFVIYLTGISENRLIVMIQKEPAFETIPPAHFKRLLEISTLLSSTLDLKQLLDLVISAAAELTDMEHASLLLYDTNTGSLNFVATSNEPGLVGLSVPLNSSLAGWTFRNEEPLIVQEVTHDRRHYMGIDEHTDIPTNSLLAVPLQTKGTTIGVLEAINKRNGGACTEQDITLLSALASQAAVAIENARLFQQTDVISEVMHELKTPLLALRSAIELLERPLPDEQRARILTTLKSEGNRLTKMVQGFLELSRLDAGKVRLAWEPLDLLQIAQDVAYIQRAQAAEKDISIKIASSTPSLPPTSGDADRLIQVLLNLVSNAIKYTQEGGQVKIYVHPEENEIYISVIDNGPGISPENLNRLFDRFYRVPGSEGFTEGTGLGLSIARKIVEAHAGRIEVQSELGKGTTFHCILKTYNSDSQ